MLPLCNLSFRCVDAGGLSTLGTAWLGGIVPHPRRSVSNTRGGARFGLGVMYGIVRFVCRMLEEDSIYLPAVTQPVG